MKTERKSAELNELGARSGPSLDKISAEGTRVSTHEVGSAPTATTLALVPAILAALAFGHGGAVDLSYVPARGVAGGGRVGYVFRLHARLGGRLHSFLHRRADRGVSGPASRRTP